MIQDRELRVIEGGIVMWEKVRYFAAIFHLSVFAISVRYFAARISVRLKTIEIANSEGTMLCKIEKNASNSGAYNQPLYIKLVL